MDPYMTSLHELHRSKKLREEETYLSVPHCQVITSITALIKMGDGSSAMLCWNESVLPGCCQRVEQD